MKKISKTLSILICVLLFASIFSAEAQLPPTTPTPPAAPVNIINQTIRGDISRTISGQGGQIEIQILGNTVDGNITINIINNKDVLKIKLIISNNEVYEEIRVQILNNELDKPSSTDIVTELENNKVGKSLTLIIGDNFVMQDIRTDANNNKVGKNMVISIGSGVVDEAYGNLVSSIDTTVKNNTVCSEISIYENENTLDFTLNSVISQNRASDHIDIDISHNTRPLGFPQLFTALSVTVSNNHVVFEDIVIIIIKNELALSGYPIIFIDIFENGAGGDVFINIRKNMAPPGIFDVTINDNAADTNMAVLIQGNVAALIQITIKDNFAFNWRPQVSSQKPVTILNNVQRDFQAQGGDSDGDGLSDNYEKRIIGTDPNNADTDNDGLFDGWNDFTLDKKVDYGGGGVLEEDFGEFGDPRHSGRGGGRRQNRGSISTLFNNKNENPSPICMDIYIETDWMPGHKPSPQAMNMIKDAFSKHLIHMHIDSGWAGGTASSKKGGEKVVKVDVIRLNTRDPGTNNDFTDFKENHFDTRRQSIFHYALFGLKFQENLQTTGAVPSASHGIADGDDIFISDANVLSFSRSLGVAKQTARAGILMHELGHNLGLLNSKFMAGFGQTLFDGIDNDTTFPLHTSYNASAFVNYNSVMNYRYALSGPIDYSDGKHGRDDFNDWASINLRRVIDYP